MPDHLCAKEAAGLDVETIRTSHFVGLSAKAFSEANDCTKSICCYSVDRELVTVRISSACARHLCIDIWNRWSKIVHMCGCTYIKIYENAGLL